MNFRANIFETVLALLTLLSLIGLGFYFYDLFYPDLTQWDPFKNYNTNPGIIKISVSAFFARTIFFLTFLLLAIDRFKDRKIILIIYLTSALTIAILQWYELYYGSTFYYGEVRDKQGLMFPVLASFMVTLTIWKIKYFKNQTYDLTTKMALTGIINIILFLLWGQVSESWNLWQS